MAIDPGEIILLWKYLNAYDATLKMRKTNAYSGTLFLSSMHDSTELEGETDATKATSCF